MKLSSFFKEKRKVLAIILFDFIIIFGLILYFGVFRASDAIKISGVYIKNPSVINDFKLVDNAGKSLTKEDLKGHWSLVFFGFTSCPMICPTTMHTLKRTHEELERFFPEKKMPKVIFISVDPARDSVEKLNNFVHSFNPNFIGARGEMNEINFLQKQLHTAVSSNPNSHGLDILLLNQDVKVQAYFSAPIEPLKLASDIKKIIQKNS